MAPLVTVLMPVYNASAFLREAIESVLTQSFSAFEFLIIDDGSTDDSVDIIKSYTDNRIRLLINHQNLGISKTLNRGVDEAACDLIARMDADDISYPDRLQKQYEFMEAHPACGLLSTWARVITHDKQFVRLEKYHREFYYYNLNFECWIYHPTVMYRKSVVVKAGYYSKPYSEDYDLFWKIARVSEIDNLDEALVDYRLSPTSLNTVTRKAEYDAANYENVIRNLRYYMGDDFTIPDDYLECLRHNFSPLIKANSLQRLLGCLSVLEAITNAIVECPNVNLRVIDVKLAAWHKRNFIVEQIFLQLTGPMKYWFALRAGRPILLVYKIQKSLRWRLNFAKERLQSLNKH